MLFKVFGCRSSEALPAVHLLKLLLLINIDEHNPKLRRACFNTKSGKLFWERAKWASLTSSLQAKLNSLYSISVVTSYFCILLKTLPNLLFLWDNKKWENSFVWNAFNDKIALALLKNTHSFSKSFKDLHLEKTNFFLYLI